MYCIDEAYLIRILNDEQHLIKRKENIETIYCKHSEKEARLLKKHEMHLSWMQRQDFPIYYEKISKRA